MSTSALLTSWGSQVLLSGLPEALAAAPSRPPPSPQSPLQQQHEQQQQQQQPQGGHVDDSPLPPSQPAPAATLLPSMECWWVCTDLQYTPQSCHPSTKERERGILHSPLELARSGGSCLASTCTVEKAYTCERAHNAVKIKVRS